MSSTTDPWLRLGTAEISDALDGLGLPGGALGIGPVAGAARLVGRAFTVRYAPASRPPGDVGDFLDDLPGGCVVVIDNSGRVDCTVWGGIMTAAAADRGLAGTVIDGACRDVAIAQELAYPLYARGRFMRTGKDRVQLAELGGPVRLGDVRTETEDLVVGDADGVVVIPAAFEDDVLERAVAIHEAEQRIVAHVRAGGALVDARRQEGYHTIQRRTEGTDAGR
jgi:regulator of RNase E activity RraA